ncbi:MAG TPA: hypothetical protein VFS15_15410 [Kofleriaceae bacterium]|nr:hypothetical protein [Kofleriaceae bacterium]
MRWLVLVVVAGSARAAAAQACGPLPANLPKQIAAAEKARDASYAKALADKKLAAWTGTPRIHASGNRYTGPVLTPPSPDVQVIDVGIGAYTAPTVELVVDAKGTVYRVVRSPRGDHPQYTRCGCGPITHGGAAPPMAHYVMELPKSVKYGGNVEIIYTDKVPLVRWTNMTGGHPCPLPP